MIVDDVADYRELLRLCLPPEFEVVGEASDGKEAVAAAMAQQPDAMILDISMPVMDGLQAIPEILELSPETRILVLSGFTEHSMSLRALDLGAHAYLEKGAKLEQIEKILAELCALTSSD